VLAACALTSPVICAAQDWPAKPLRFIVPFAAGGSTDQVARILGERLSATLGQQIIIDNRGGGNGVLGTALARSRRPTAITISSCSTATRPIRACRKICPTTR
jgi:tripartite-type tricarboxylate transporter receptor subunit TctC